ncbi:hypothetical protein B0J13DRAFT_628501 [Dactylonectria estremocensis]|uniref:Uncharacterized protein n=1 Tax=Dactylonectria estremocensis TaxID=1079267 RepID=A0A9P9DME0_9HYPO|nr:hypothetical protein B0J13DRAFT_628501 [Dactylonectria estremocensis]
MAWLGTLMSRNGNPTLQSGSPLEVSSSLAACLVLLAMMPKLTPGWVGQILVIVAGTLGCNTIDWLLCYAVITARTFSKLVSDAPPMCSSGSSPRPFCATRLACHMAFALIRAVCLPLLVLLSVYALLFPYSETSIGGNYNLHFLDSTSRRALYLSEPVTLSSLGLSKHGKHIPKHALVPYLPLSLYVPNAGFLWAEADNPEAEDQTETQSDVFFSDPFGKRYPWALEEPDPPGGSSTKRSLSLCRVMFGPAR